MISTDELQGLPDAAQAEIRQLRSEKAEWTVERRIFELKVRKLERMLWARKSERLAPKDERQTSLFSDPAGEAPAPMPPAPKPDGKERSQSTGSGLNSLNN